MSVLYIGIAGVSRSGKDSLAAHIEKRIRHESGKTIYKTSLALPLKEDCRDFVRQYLNLNIFTDKTEDKATFREMLVWYGKVKRQQTQGTHWTNLLDQRVSKFTPDICIIPDIRYQQYERDEVNWLKEDHSGVLIHLQRIGANGDVVPPANMDETINDSIIQNMADYKLTWPTFGEDKEPRMAEMADEVFQAVIRRKL